MPSPFEVENRKIVYWPVGDMSMKNWEANLPQLVEAVDTIIGERLDQKGVIHTSSYKRARNASPISSVTRAACLTSFSQTIFTNTSTIKPSGICFALLPRSIRWLWASRKC